MEKLKGGEKKTKNLNLKKMNCLQWKRAEWWPALQFFDAFLKMYFFFRVNKLNLIKYFIFFNNK